MANTSGSITTTQKNHLNNMNRAAQDVGLGTRLTQLPTQLVTGSYTLQAADVAGVSTTVFDGFTKQKGFIVQATRSGSFISGSAVAAGAVISKFSAVLSGSSLVVYSGSTLTASTLAAADVLTYIIF
jgi:hypothetical protein